MTVEIAPELENLIREDLARGAYSSVEEYVARAVAALHAQEAELEAERRAISDAIDVGYEQAMRGEVVSADEVFRRLGRRIDSHRRS